MTKIDIKPIDIVGHIGEFKLLVKENGIIVEEIDFTNLITNAYLDELLKVPQGVTPDLQIKYLAVGTGTTTPSATDTTLETEIFRTAVTTQSKTGTGELTTTFVVLDSEAVATWGELGIFAGSTATATANTGVLISRVLYSRNKTALEEIQITRKDIFGRA